MSDRKNFGHGQIVTEGHMDTAFDYPENSEHNQAVDAGECQDAATGSPTIYGGILSGLIVTAVANDNKVSVTIGVCKDQAGRRISIPASTVNMLYSGDTDEGDSTPATGDGALMTTSCPNGQYIIASLFGVYDENLQDEMIDASSAHYFFTIVESFHFKIGIGTSFVAAPGTLPSRASLIDDQVLLADILLYNDGGTIKVKQVAVKTQDFAGETLVNGQYHNLTGRRSDWLACDQTADFPQFQAKDVELRQPVAREAIYDLIKKLQAQTDPAGASLVGSRAQTSTLSYEALTAKTVLAGSIDTQILSILNSINTKLSLGGGNLLKPTTGVSGIVGDTSTLDDDQALIQHTSLDANNAAQTQKVFNHKFGHDSKPHELFDDFLYPSNGTIPIGFDAGTAANDKWGIGFGGPGTGAAYNTISELGGVLRLTTNNQSGGYIWIGSGSATPQLYHWNCGGDPWVIAMIRFRYSHVLASQMHFSFGFFSAGTDWVSVYQDLAGPLYLQLKGATTTGPAVEVLPADSLSPGWWYTLRLGVIGNSSGQSTKAIAQVNNGIIATAHAHSLPLPADPLTDTGYYLRAQIETATTASAYLDIDQMGACDHRLASDML